MKVIAWGIPSWQSCLALAFKGSALLRKRPGMRHCKPLTQAVSTSGTRLRLQKASTQWSMALQPDWSQMFIGVVRARLASRMMRRGPRRGLENWNFWPSLSRVTPAKFEYSPPDRDVGMEMTGHLGGLAGAVGLEAWGRAMRSDSV